MTEKLVRDNPRCVHRKSYRDTNQIRGRDGNTFSHLGSRRVNGEEDSLEGHSREKLTEMVMNEREKF